MSNVVSNTITIKGRKEDRDQLLLDAKKDENGKLYFSSWFPIPETFLKYDTTNHPNGERLKVGAHENWSPDSQIVTKELIEEYKKATKEQKEKYGVVGWYDYNCQTFGCKWDCHIEIKNNAEDVLTLICETPWAAPKNFLLSMSLRYPNLSFHISSGHEQYYYEEDLIEKGQLTILISKEIEYDE